MRFHWNLARLRQYLCATRRRIRGDKTLQNWIAENLVGIIVWTVFIEFLIVFFGIIGVVYSVSAFDVGNVGFFVFELVGPIYLAFAAFHFLYVRPKIIFKSESLSSVGKYNVLGIMQRSRIAGIFVVIPTTAALSIVLIAQRYGTQDFLNSIVFHKIMMSMDLFYMGTLLGLMPIALFYSFSHDTEAKMSFEIIQNFDAIAERAASSYRSAYVWKGLTTNIVHETKTILKDNLGFSEGTITEPFNVVSLAATMNDKEQVVKAKKWMKELQSIVLNDDMEEKEKAELILCHMRKAEIDFPKEVDLCKKYNFDFKLEPKRTKRSQDALNAVAAAVTIGGFIILMIEVYLHGW
jgi:hypothetical protein